MAGKTKQQITSFSRLRGSGVQIKKPLDLFPNFPERGVLDLQRELRFQQERQLAPAIPEQLSPLLAPLSAVSYQPENTAAWQQEAERAFWRREAEVVQLSPEKSCPTEWDGGLLPGQALFAPLPGQQLVAITRPNLERGPRQVVGLEAITPDPQMAAELAAGRCPDFEFYAVAHWAYDPLSAQWLLLNRWGAADTPFQSLNLHAPVYQQRQEAEQRQQEIADHLYYQAVGDPKTILQLPSNAQRLTVLDSPQRLIQLVSELDSEHPLRKINNID